MNGLDDVLVEREGRIERVRDWQFEGEEPVTRPGGAQMASRDTETLLSACQQDVASP